MTEQEKMIDLVTEVRDNCYCQAQDYEDPLLFEKARILDSAVEALQKIRWIPCMEKCRRSERPCEDTISRQAVEALQGRK